MQVSNTKGLATMHCVKGAILVAMSLSVLAASCLAQQTGGYGVPGTGTSGTIAFNGAPTGSCSSTQTAVDTTTGNYYSCNNSAWQKVGPGSGGTPSGTAGGSLAGNYPNPSLAAQAANTLLGNNTGSSAAPAALTVSQVAALLGLGTAASQPASAFDASGAAAAAQAASLQKASNLSDLASASTARTNLGLGSAATQASTAFDASGAAATAQANAIAASAPSACANGSYACSASPALTGTPTAPTQAISTNNNDIATTAAVTSALAGLGSGTVSGQASGVIPLGTSGTVIGGQSHLSDASGQITSAEPFGSVAAGTFSTSAFNSYLNSTINACNPTTQFFAVQSGYATSAITGCITGSSTSPGSGFNQYVGVLGIATSTNVNAVGGSFYGFSQANNARAYGGNLLWQDISGLTTGVQGVGGEIDVQPFNAPSAYTQLTGLTLRMFNIGGQGGNYPATAVTLAGGANGGGSAPWRTGFNFSMGSLGSASTAINVNALGTAVSGSNYNCPTLLTAYESYWNGTAATNEGWSLGCAVGGGTNPNSDQLQISHSAGSAPAGQTNYFDLTSGIQLELDGATSGSTYLSASPTGGTLNLGSTNATVTPAGALTVTSCTGCGTTASVSSVFTRTGAVVAASGDYTVSQITGAAPLASPAFSGTPTAPTQAISTNNTDIATTAAVNAALAGYATSGANANITSLTGLTTPLTVGQGGIGAATSAANTVFGNFTGGTAAPGFSTAPVFSAASLTNFPTFNQNTTGSAATVPFTGITGGGANTVTTPSSFAAPMTFSAPGAASQPGVLISGAPYTSGTGTINFPQLYVMWGTNTPSFNTNGTAIGINAATGFGGYLIDTYVGGGEKYYVTSGGAAYFASNISNSGNITSNGAITASTAGAVNLSTVNSTAATASSCSVSGAITEVGKYWNGSVSATDTISLTPTCTPGTNGAETLTFSNSGSTGQLTVAVTGQIAPNQPLTSVSCATSGTVQFAEPEAGISDKRVKAYANACVGAASYTFPVAFTNTPAIVTTNEVSSSTITALSTTAMTITGSSTTGFIVIEGW